MGDLRGVIAFAATDVEPGAGLAFGGQFSQAPGDRRVVASIKEVAAGFDHRLVVAWIAAVLVLHRQQVQVALAGTVEAMPGGAHHAVVEPRQGGLAERAGEHQASNRTRVW